MLPRHKTLCKLELWEQKAGSYQCPHGTHMGPASPATLGKGSKVVLFCRPFTPGGGGGVSMGLGFLQAPLHCVFTHQVSLLRAQRGQWF